ncbi:hypothetical protein [Halobellus sp. Atlit-38R]|jgi:hypothetical protein|nr:hypothetical protein [Halobellus sp. Atlit-38R]
MTQRTPTDERGSETEPNFYLPAGSPSTSVAGRIERIWAKLFSHGVETPA